MFKNDPDIVPKVHYFFCICVVPVHSGQTMFCGIATGDYGRQRSRGDGWENNDTVWVRYPARVSSVKCGSLPCSRAGTKALEVQPSMTQRSTFFKMWSIK
jgi:hypothetical protein